MTILHEQVPAFSLELDLARSFGAVLATSSREHKMFVIALLTLALLPSALSLRLPHAPSPAVRSAVASRTGSLVVLMAKKKKKMKAPKGAAASLAALDAWEANLGAPGGVDADIDDPLAPVVAKKGKMTSKGQKKDVPVEDEEEPVAEASAAPVAAAAPAASPAAAAPATLADKVTRIKLELGLDETLPLAQAVTAANEAMGLPPGGSIADQVAELLMQLAIEM